MEGTGGYSQEWDSTDLFLLNASRFNQQIIGVIKRHPLLEQEPAEMHAD